ncbi:MAG: hypothetical protein RUDDFDWM_001108 [Candidatus Fervidibacterota bacterium]
MDAVKMIAQAKPLSELINVLKQTGLLVSVIGRTDKHVNAITNNSTQAEKGFAFVCIKGLKHDGHDFINERIKRGVDIFVVEDEREAQGKDVTFIKVRDTRKAFGILSSALYDEPSRSLRLVGITGTNGKTTTAFMIAACLQSIGRKVAVMGTLGALSDEGFHTELPHTTPEAHLIQSHLRWFANKGIQDVVMEVSSHALSQDRVFGCAFDVGVFTNLTQDHLDYHGDMESYFTAKSMLFTCYAEYARSVGKEFTAVINADNSYGKRLIEMCQTKLITYGVSEERDIFATDINVGREKTVAKFHIKPTKETFELKLPLIGLFNIYNALAAIATLVALGENVTPAIEVLESFKPPRGRLERVDMGQPFSVLVDYAHTPDSLLQVLRALKPLKGDGRLIVVFGCGGDRDKTKRPKMGYIASNEADIVVITSDNPRSEDPLAIIQQILEGVDETLRHKVYVEPDRRKAIFRAIMLAKANDIVLIAGKGHETYQLIGQEKIPFDDREVAKEALSTIVG